MKKRRVFAAVVLCCLLLFAGAAVSFASEQEPSERSKWQYLSDMRGLMRHVEEIHPAFSLGRVPGGYETVKAEVLDTIRSGVTAEEFAMLKARYLAQFQDAHTTGNLVPTGPRLELSWCFREGTAYVLDPQGQRTAVTVLAIGGITANNVFRTVNQYFPTENETARQQVLEQWGLYRCFLEEAGCSLEKDKAEVLLKEGRVTWTEFVRFTEEKKEDNTHEPGTEPEEELPLVYGGMVDGGIYYLRLGVCEDNEVLDQQCQLLQQEISQGCSKVILDIRGNEGGTWLCPMKLFAAMGMREPVYGVYSRYSNYLQEMFPQFTQESFAEIPANLGAAIPNPGIRLVVLTDENTFGTATMIGVWVQDGRLGRVVGRISRNAPSMYGDALPYTMPYTGECVPISYRWFTRPNPYANQTSLVPDIETAEGEDILARAVGLLLQ